LELVVAIDSIHTATTRKADWILPSTSFWEREDLSALALSMLPARTLQATAPVLPPHGESREEQAILSDLFRATSPSLRGGEWGLHLRMAGRQAAVSDLPDWTNKLLELIGQPNLAALKAMPRGVDDGELDRAEWRVERPDGRIDLAPGPLQAAVAAAAPPVLDPELPRWLVTRTRSANHLGTHFTADPDLAQTVAVHPSCGVADGKPIVVTTRFGEARGIARHDENLREDTVEVPWSSAFDAGQLISDQDLDPHTGTPDQVGVGCQVRPN
jgi:formate dehydrogenase